MNENDYRIDENNYAGRKIRSSHRVISQDKFYIIILWPNNIKIKQIN